MSVRRALHGHFWTVQPHVVATLRPPQPPRDEPFTARVEDPTYGALRLTGWLHAPPGEDELVVVVHGLGGMADSRYVVNMARQLAREGRAYLRLNLRGADRSGEDIYHAGLHADLHGALASPQIARFRRLVLVGFSMGGHVSLRYAADPGHDPRLRAVVAICAPLDLAFTAEAFQRPQGRIYQPHVMSGLKEMYVAASRRGRPLPIPVEDVQRLETVLEWDDEVVAPRFGFRDRHDYYARSSAGPELRRVDVRTLFVATEADPMVTAEGLRPSLEAASDAVEVAWVPGGHVGFPSRLRIQDGPPTNLEGGVLRWLGR
jgi:predicted alpha/beta-fold hydrolase